jgi:flavin-dependent thymidylate synthase
MSNKVEATYHGKEVSKWSDGFMFTAEKSDASKDPEAYLLGASPDPLGQIAAACKTYLGEYTHDLADITDAERRHYLEEIQKTVLTMPLETVSLHFFIEGVHRGITHQMVRQRTAAFAQESTRFAVKEDLATAVALPPSLRDTLPWEEYMDNLGEKLVGQGLAYGSFTYEQLDDMALEEARRTNKSQAHRKDWDEAVKAVSSAYNKLVNDGMPAEEARGLMPTNTVTRLNYITNLRSFYDTMSKRVGDQAQFEWRLVIAAMVKAMQDFGLKSTYEVKMTWAQVKELTVYEEFQWQRVDRTAKTPPSDNELYIVQRSSAWQYDALVAEIKPIEFKLGKRAFAADFDRPSRIGERVDAFAAMGVPSSRWIEGAPEFNIPGIRPEEWLLDPHSARLASDMEFDIWGNRVPKASGTHWVREVGSKNNPLGPGLVDPAGNVAGWDGTKVVEFE